MVQKTTDPKEIPSKEKESFKDALPAREQAMVVEPKHEHMLGIEALNEAPEEDTQEGKAYS